jgi:hypothetical protein
MDNLSLKLSNEVEGDIGDDSTKELDVVSVNESDLVFLDLYFNLRKCLINLILLITPLLSMSIS